MVGVVVIQPGRGVGYPAGVGVQETVLVVIDAGVGRIILCLTGEEVAVVLL